jgi:serine protease Do
MRGLPRIVARTPIGKEVEVDVLRNGKTEKVKVQVGRLPEGETPPPVAEKTEEKKAPEGKTVLGLSISELSDELRSRYGISKKVSGVVITKVDPKSDAAQKDIQAGQVIVEVTQQEVKTPDDVSKRLAVVKERGRKSVLLLISDAKGDLRFVAIPIKG